MIGKSTLSRALCVAMSLSVAALVVHARPSNPPERHPEMHAALRHLKDAKTNLEKGDHDFGGHRVAAVSATDQAIKEVEAALAFDKD